MLNRKLLSLRIVTFALNYFKFSIIRIHTAQNVVLNYQLASVGRRLGAAALDILLIGIFSSLIYYFITSSDILSSFENTGSMTFVTLCYLPIILYYPILEYFMNGKTVGKAILKIRVTKINGKPAALNEILLRWLLRMVDMKIGLFIFILSALVDSVGSSEQLIGAVSLLIAIPFPIVAIISILVTKENQRIGDLAAETIVIHDQQRVSLDETLLRSKIDDYQPVFQQVLKLRDKDIYIIKKVVGQAESGDHSKVVPLASKAKAILKVKSDLLPLVFLKTLLNDYNHLAQERDLQ